MFDDDAMSLGHYKIKTSTMITQTKRSQPSADDYDDIGGFGEHMENYNVETTALHRKLQSKMEALRILRKELEKFRTERDQFKLMAETLQLRYAALRRSSLSDLTSVTSGESSTAGGSSSTAGGLSSSGTNKSSVARILHETRERNIKLTTEVEALKQKLTEVQGDIEILRAHKMSTDDQKKASATKKSLGKNNKTGNDEILTDECTKQAVLKWKEERSNFICHLEQWKKKNAQLAFDLKAIIDEKEELINERDAYKCKAHRLNHELLAALKAKEKHPKFLDIDSVLLENKYLYERLKNLEDEIEITKHSLTKYKSILENKRKKGIMKLGGGGGGGGGHTPTNNYDENILSHKQVKNLLESGIDLPTKTETIQDLKALCLALLDNLNDKNLALNHQKKTNKILATKIAELDQRMKTLAGLEQSDEDENGFSASKYLLKGYCPSTVDSESSKDNKQSEEQNQIKSLHQQTSSVSNSCKSTTTDSTLNGSNATATEDSATMSSETGEQTLKYQLKVDAVAACNYDDAMSSTSSLSTGSGRSILSSEYDLGNHHAAVLNLNDFTNAALFYAYKTPSSTSESGGKTIQRKDSTRSLTLPQSIIKERNDDLKDLPPELAALVQKALHELDLRDFDEVVEGVCEDVAQEALEQMPADEKMETTDNCNVADIDNFAQEDLNSGDEMAGAIGGMPANLIIAN